jgi:hypothetical protein
VKRTTTCVFTGGKLVPLIVSVAGSVASRVTVPIVVIVGALYVIVAAVASAHEPLANVTRASTATEASGGQSEPVGRETVTLFAGPTRP